MQRVTDLADPTRCKGAAPDGQCMNQAEDGSEFCLAHGGVNRGPARRMRKYLLANAEDQGLLDRYLADDQLKSLREEIALIRVMIQTTLRMAQSEVERVNAYSQINKYMLTAEKLLTTCHKLEQSLGELVGKPALIRLGQQLCQIVVNRLEGVPGYEQLVDVVVADMAAAFENISNAEPSIEDQ